MELKLRISAPVKSSIKILIAPIWNWNNIIKIFHPAIDRHFNRTNMELKHSIAEFKTIGNGLILIAPIWNWNILEKPDFILPDLYFNRTNMELKLTYSEKS